jgi:hypothetical protein
MPEKKKKTEPKPGPTKKPKEEEVIDGEVVEEPTAEEKVPEAKIVKAMPDYDQLMNLSDVFSKAGLFPGIENQYQAAAVIQLGREINLPGPMISLKTIYVIPSKKGSTLCIKTEALLALAIDKGVHLEVLSKTHKGCKLRFSRKGQKDHVEEYTEEDAKRAGVLTYDNWMKHPKNMYYWRCVKNGLQSFDARLSLGITTQEELEDIGDITLAQRPVSEKQTKEEEEKPKVTFTKTKDQPAAEPEPKKEEKPPEPPPPESPEVKLAKNQTAEKIKSCLKEASVDEKLFKKWLGEELQLIRPDRKFVGLKFGNWSFNEGNLDDLLLLSENMEWAIVKGYLESKTFKEEAQKKEPGEEEEEVPF